MILKLLSAMMRQTFELEDASMMGCPLTVMMDYHVLQSWKHSSCMNNPRARERALTCIGRIPECLAEECCLLKTSGSALGELKWKEVHECGPVLLDDNVDNEPCSMHTRMHTGGPAPRFEHH